MCDERSIDLLVSDNPSKPPSGIRKHVEIYPCLSAEKKRCSRLHSYPKSSVNLLQLMKSQSPQHKDITSTSKKASWRSYLIRMNFLLMRLILILDGILVNMVVVVRLDMVVFVLVLMLLLVVIVRLMLQSITTMMIIMFHLLILKVLKVIRISLIIAIINLNPSQLARPFPRKRNLKLAQSQAQPRHYPASARAQAQSPTRARARTSSAAQASASSRARSEAPAPATTPHGWAMSGPLSGWGCGGRRSNGNHTVRHAGLDGRATHVGESGQQVAGLGGIGVIVPRSRVVLVPHPAGAPPAIQGGLNGCGCSGLDEGLRVECYLCHCCCCCRDGCPRDQRGEEERGCDREAGD
ncbi:hypothetical protein B0T17DRAFT_117616 [Bombardia bombarda]|uniref:Uncharacterized protein n=1 Tax=Bombardia bombarda TaxID=252184 RepID=A0AA39U1L3_9PEZI|nr:hypothetical protein B0T17DRAFT_117616 [Bombardia bombarda]